MSAYAARLKSDMQPLLQELRELNDLEAPTDEQKSDIDRITGVLTEKKTEYDRAIVRFNNLQTAEATNDALSAPAPAPRAVYDRPAIGAGQSTPEVKALSSYLVDNRDYKNPRSGMYNVAAEAPIAALYPYVERKAAFVPGNLTAIGGPLQVFGPNTPRVPHPILEFLRTVPYNEYSVPYLAPVFTNNAADVAIGNPKPESTNTGTIQTVNMHTIAHWKDVPRQILRYIPSMRAIIDDELIGGVLSKVEDVIINGTGAAGSMLGILAQVTTTGAGADMVAAILNALGVIGARGGTPDGILMNPSDYYALIASAYTGNKYNPIVSAGRFAGVPVIQEGSLAAGTTIVGDWNRAVALYVGENANVRATEALGMKSNLVTVLGEMDCVVLVERPNLLVKTTAAIP
jgi:hypothetical protein